MHAQGGIDQELWPREECFTRFLACEDPHAQWQTAPFGQTDSDKVNPQYRYSSAWILLTHSCSVNLACLICIAMSSAGQAKSMIELPDWTGADPWQDVCLLLTSALDVIVDLKGKGKVLVNPIEKNKGQNYSNGHPQPISKTPENDFSQTDVPAGKSEVDWKLYLCDWGGYKQAEVHLQKQVYHD